MQPALFLGGFLPPPAARPFVLVRRGGPRARLAPDRDESSRMQRIERHVVNLDVVPDLPRGPVAERVELHERPLGAAEGAIELDDRYVGPRARALILALARHPRRLVGGQPHARRGDVFGHPGAADGNRTRKPGRAADFKSVESTNFSMLALLWYPRPESNRHWPIICCTRDINPLFYH